MTNSEPQITDADRAAAKQWIAEYDSKACSITYDEVEVESLASVIANYMAPEREAHKALRKKQSDVALFLRRKNATLREAADRMAAFMDRFLSGDNEVDEALAAYRAACKTETTDE